MDILFSILHVVAAVFIVGPMAILPMTGLRALRSGSATQVRTLATSTMIFTWLSALVIVFGFGILGTSAEAKKYGTTFTTPWVLWSLIAWAVAFALTLFVVVPQMRKAADAIPADGSEAVKPANYGVIAASSGIASLALVVAVLLMVWKP